MWLLLNPRVRNRSGHSWHECVRRVKSLCESCFVCVLAQLSLDRQEYAYSVRSSKLCMCDLYTVPIYPVLMGEQIIDFDALFSSFLFKCNKFKYAFNFSPHLII